MKFVSFFLGAVLASSAAPAVAQQLSFADAQADIESNDAERIQTGIQSLGLSGEARGVPILAARIQRGLPPDLLEAALDTLAVLGRAEAGPVLIQLLSHRRASIRLRAVQALGTCHPSGADHALAIALSDAAPEVRTAAATALGDVGGTGAMDQLFQAFDHGIVEAGMAIARLARAEDVTRMLGSLGHVPFTQMSPILADMLGRTTIPERSRLAIVAALGEQASAESRALLEQYVHAHPGTSALTRAAEAAAARIAQ
jgi:hypothetical protein